MKFFYQIKAKTQHYGDYAPVYIGHVEAENRKEAKAKLNDDFQENFKEKITSKSPEVEYRLLLLPADSTFEEYWLTPRVCSVCKEAYTVIEKRNMGEVPGREVCSTACRIHNRPPPPEHLESFAYGNQKPTIYRITNKSTDQCYIGQTIRPVTLRWWEHFFHPAETKFHKAIQESGITDWTFEVLEVLETRVKKEINAREQYWITKHQSILHGYNSATAQKEAINEEINLPPN